MSLSAFIYSTVSPPASLFRQALHICELPTCRFPETTGFSLYSRLRVLRSAVLDAGPGQALECMSEFGSIPNSDSCPL
eukprot:jgi/Botrbrau1/9457/Bobra.0252s0078.1